MMPPRSFIIYANMCKCPCLSEQDQQTSDRPPNALERERIWKRKMNHARVRGYSSHGNITVPVSGIHMWEKQKPDHKIRLSLENYSIPRTLPYITMKKQPY